MPSFHGNSQVDFQFAGQLLKLLQVRPAGQGDDRGVRDQRRIARQLRDRRTRRFVRRENVHPLSDESVRFRAV